MREDGDRDVLVAGRVFHGPADRDPGTGLAPDGPAFQPSSVDVVAAATGFLQRVVEANPEEPKTIKTIRGAGYMFVPQRD